MSRFGVITRNGIVRSFIEGSQANLYDPDAQAFFTAASITDNTQKSAVNTLVLSLKSANIWSKMKALYPIVGGVASAHAVNLKQPGTYNLTFATGWNHTSTGMTPNGATYADTNLIPNTALTSNSHHLSFYSRTNNTTTAYDMACQSIQASSTQYGYMLLSTYNTGTSRYQQQTQNAYAITVSEANTLGFYQGSRTSSTSFKAFKNGILRGNNTALASTISSYLPINSIYLSAFNFNNNGAISTSDYSNRQCAFASIGDGLTDTDASNFYNAVQAYQTTLNRQVP
jgi:hypothetical protein